MLTYLELSPKNQTKTIKFRVRNTDEGGDYADMTLVVTNTVLSGANCTASIKAKAQALGVAFTGAPTSNINSPSTVKDGKRVTFRKVDVYCSKNAGTHEVHGAIRQKYNHVGGPNDALSLPVTDETTTPDRKGKFNHFIETV